MPACRVGGFVLLLALLAAPLPADGPADNNPETVRRVPKLGIELSAEDAASLKAGLAELETKLAKLREPQADAAKQARRQRYLPDVEVLHKAVHDALVYQEFFNPNEVPAARELLQLAGERADQLAAGDTPWTRQTGLVVRGYRSKIDGSVQPYGLIVPSNVVANPHAKVRLDAWCHGRGETLSELAFLDQRRKQVGQISPPGAIVLHLYGRYCNANKFAGEIDLFEALEAVGRDYPVDEDRIAIRGFSMGGAACWQFAVHYADRWAAAAPGAGFSETPEFLKSFQQEKLNPPWYEEKLWRWYDCPGYAINLFNCPTVAYSGELDIQKQAADVMDKALFKHGISLVHLIGPQTKHAYHPETAAEIERRITQIVAQGRVRVPPSIHFATYTLRYPRMHWITIDGLGEHWEQATVRAKIASTSQIEIQTKNVRDLSIHIPSGGPALELSPTLQVQIDSTKWKVHGRASDRSLDVAWHLEGDRWEFGARPMTDGELRKIPGLQGPIDDAFLDSFLFVKPSGGAHHERLQAWAAAELDRAIEHWRRHFRGVARVKLDTEITPEDIAGANLVLWGDPASNTVMKQVMDRLPLKWDREKVAAGTQSFDAATHALVGIYPNPLNPKRYVVLNSGFTFRDYDYLNNARQTPKLPDWAIVDLTTPPGSQWPGKIVAADFFDERWQLKPARPAN